MTIEARIPGEPVAQGRPRARVHPRGYAYVYDPPESRNWKAMAHDHLRRALEASGLSWPIAGPVRCDIVAVFTCPPSQWRKSTPRPRRPHCKRPDADNVAKIVLDAAIGVLWIEDAQVAELSVQKIIGAQGEAPYVQVSVSAVRVPEVERPRSVGAVGQQQQPAQARLL